MIRTSRSSPSMAAPHNTIQHTIMYNAPLCHADSNLSCYETFLILIQNILIFSHPLFLDFFYNYFVNDLFVSFLKNFFLLSICDLLKKLPARPELNYVTQTLFWLVTQNFWFHLTWAMSRDPIRDPVCDPIRDPRSDPVQFRFCRRRCCHNRSRFIPIDTSARSIF